ASDTQHPQGPVVVFPTPEPVDLRRTDTIVLVDISDPGNVGTIIRSAVAFDWAVAIAGDTADPWSPKAIRSSASTVFGVPISKTETPLEFAAELDMTSVASVVQGGETAPQVTGPTVLLIGAEASGLPQSLVHGADIRLTIPMPGGTESLNAAVAAAIAMYSIAASR
ncbi:MAG: TrmH family RNA methyltransferase, partial [Acidimicrobiia bacterium]